MQPSRIELRALKDAFLALRTTSDLCQLVEEDVFDLNQLALDPKYEDFIVPKRNGDPRYIEDPEPKLKSVQRKLNTLLQGVYHFNRSTAAYGFITACADDPPHMSRGIVNNARQHLGQPWMLNMDILDFFHHIKTEKVCSVLLSQPFSFDEELADLLTRLCTYKGRLPMGSPASPILSNFAARPLDAELETLAQSRQWVFSRYADDMTISSRDEITEADIELLRGYYRAHSFEANERKTKLMGPDDEHIVTGIRILEDRLDLSSEFYGDLGTEIRHLKDINSVKGRLGVSLMDWVDEYADRIRGMIAFADHVLGEHHPKVQKARQNLAKALEQPKDFGTLSWLDWPYN